MATFECIDTEMGGMMAGSAGKLPRSKRQLSIEQTGVMT